MGNRERLGNFFILPSSHIGSPRHMHQLYQNAMDIIRRLGNPDLFITVTCNPNWPEMKQVLSKFPSWTTCNDIPLITTRLFQAKLRAIIADILSGKVFGKIIGHLYTIEFQKRSLPHAHLIFILNYQDKLQNAEDINKFVKPVIPEDDEEIRKLVMQFMLHGQHSEKSPCYNKENDKCSKNYPKAFNDVIYFDEKGFPQYERPDNSSMNYTYPNKVNGQWMKVDNSIVVPYSPYLLKKYKCHINVEMRVRRFKGVW